MAPNSAVAARHCPSLRSLSHSSNNILVFSLTTSSIPDFGLVNFILGLTSTLSASDLDAGIKQGNDLLLVCWLINPDLLKIEILGFRAWVLEQTMIMTV